MEIKLLKHCGEPRIAVYFEKNAALIRRIKAVEDARWSQTKDVWHLPLTSKLFFYVIHLSKAMLQHCSKNEFIINYRL